MINPPLKFYVDPSAKVIKDKTSNEDLLKIELRHTYGLEAHPVKIAAGSNGA
jgi:hypothetical protein